MKQSNNFIKLEDRLDGRVYWNGVRIKTVRENTNDIFGKEYAVSPSIQHYFIKTGSTTKSLNKILKKKRSITLGFYNTRHNKGLKAAKMRDASHHLPKAIDKIRITPLPINENVTDSDFEGRGLKIKIPSNIIDIYTRLEILLVLKLSSQTDRLKEASNLIDEIYKGGEIENK